MCVSWLPNKKSGPHFGKTINNSKQKHPPSNDRHYRLVVWKRKRDLVCVSSSERKTDFEQSKEVKQDKIKLIKRLTLRFEMDKKHEIVNQKESKGQRSRSDSMWVCVCVCVCWILVIIVHALYPVCAAYGKGRQKKRRLILTGFA